MSRMIAGCGYLGKRVAEWWCRQGENVVALTRSPARAAEFGKHGWTPIVADIAQGSLLEVSSNLTAGVETLLFAVGYDRSSSYDHGKLHPEGLQILLSCLPALKRVIYISTTGVYGGSGGVWLNEESPTSPDRESSAASFAAEKVATAWAQSGEKIAISLRMGGLYGPGRIPHLAKLRAGEPLSATPGGFLNLIHVDDAARITSLMADAAFPPILNVTDGMPVERGAFYAEIARQIGAPDPTYEPVFDGAGTRSRGFGNRRISNALLVENLAAEDRENPWHFPDYRQGIAHSLRDSLRDLDGGSAAAN